MSTEESEIIVIQENEVGERIDKILANRFKEVRSRTYFQYLIKEKLILLNGQPIKKGIKPDVGDEVEVQFALTPEIDLQPEPIFLDIIYEDEYILVINKPVGMVVHPAPGNWSGTFVNALLYHCQNLAVAKDQIRPGIVHRLDKDTSGILIAAKTTEAQQRLVESFASRQVYKEYLTICVGNPGEVKMDAPIGRHPVHRKQMAVIATGRAALTYCYPIAWDGKLSIVKIVIATGRTHQIRVHLKDWGTPVLGDMVYGQSQMNKRYAISHQLLHAVRLRLKHPITRQEMEFVAQPSSEMVDHLNKIDPHWMKQIF